MTFGTRCSAEDDCNQLDAAIRSGRAKGARCSDRWGRGGAGLLQIRTPPLNADAKRQDAEDLVRKHQLSVQRACRVVRLSRAAFYRPPVPTRRLKYARFTGGRFTYCIRSAGQWSTTVIGGLVSC